jgi:hypothetical protein
MSTIRRKTKHNTCPDKAETPEFASFGLHAAKDAWDGRVGHDGFVSGQRETTAISRIAIISSVRTKTISIVASAEAAVPPIAGSHASSSSRLLKNPRMSRRELFGVDIGGGKKEHPLKGL